MITICFDVNENSYFVFSKFSDKQIAQPQKFNNIILQSLIIILSGNWFFWEHIVCRTA